ncbi:MAG: TRAP transporter small permease [Gammaproteobacteria bacterium]|nr:TRAP transporter small permease [Gammaproteobacteria bacterium]
MRESFLSFYERYTRILYYLAFLAGLATFIIMCLIDASALTRKFLNWPLPGSVEITEALMVVGIILPMAYAQATRYHLRVPLLTNHLPLRFQQVFHVVAMFIGFLFFAAMTWSAFSFTYESFRIDEHVWGANVRFPLYPVKGVMCLGFLMLAIQFLLDTVKILIFGPEEFAENELGSLGA